MHECLRFTSSDYRLNAFTLRNVKSSLNIFQALTQTCDRGHDRIRTPISWGEIQPHPQSNSTHAVIKTWIFVLTPSLSASPSFVRPCTNTRVPSFIPKLSPAFFLIVIFFGSCA